MNDLEELNAALNGYVNTIRGVPLTRVDVTARFMVYSSLMRQYGVDRAPIMVIADRMPIETMDVPHVSKLAN